MWRHGSKHNSSKHQCWKRLKTELGENQKNVEKKLLFTWNICANLSWSRPNILGGGRGLRKVVFLGRGGTVKKFQEILQQICKNLEGWPKNFKNCHFLAKKRVHHISPGPGSNCEFSQWQPSSYPNNCNQVKLPKALKECPIRRSHSSLSKWRSFPAEFSFDAKLKFKIGKS